MSVRHEVGNEQLLKELNHVIPLVYLANWMWVEIITRARLWCMVLSGWPALSMNALIGVNDG